MDIIKLVGGKPANFMDIGGGANAERVAKSMQIILSDPNVKAILINIFGGITRCDEVATGILEVFPQFSDKLPVVVRFVGTNAELALDMLDNTKIIFADSLFGSAEKVVEALKGLENEYSYR